MRVGDAKCGAQAVKGQAGDREIHAQFRPQGKGKIYRVRVGPYKSEAEAGQAAVRLGKQEKIKSPWVVPDGK